MEVPRALLIIAITVLAMCKRNQNYSACTLMKKGKILSKREFYRSVAIKRKLNRNMFNENKQTHLVLLLILSGDIELNPGPVNQNRYVAKSIVLFYLLFI